MPDERVQPEQRVQPAPGEGSARTKNRRMRRRQLKLSRAGGTDHREVGGAAVRAERRDGAPRRRDPATSSPVGPGRSGDLGELNPRWSGLREGFFHPGSGSGFKKKSGLSSGSGSGSGFKKLKSKPASGNVRPLSGLPEQDFWDLREGLISIEELVEKACRAVQGD